jgi:nitrogen fixation protein NifT
MKIMLRRSSEGILSAYVPKKDLEEPIVAMDKPQMWGGCVTLANGWRLELPMMSADTVLPITVEARRLAETANAPSLAHGPRLDPIGEGATGSSAAGVPPFDPVGD